MSQYDEDDTIEIAVIRQETIEMQTPQYVPPRSGGKKTVGIVLMVLSAPVAALGLCTLPLFGSGLIPLLFAGAMFFIGLVLTVS